MTSPQEIVNEINGLISHLMRNDLVDDQNFAYSSNRGGGLFRYDLKDLSTLQVY